MTNQMFVTDSQKEAKALNLKEKKLMKVFHLSASDSGWSGDQAGTKHDLSFRPTGEIYVIMNKTDFSLRSK